MKTPLLCFKDSLSPSVLDDSIVRNIGTMRYLAGESECTYEPMQTILYNLCYKLPFVKGSPKYKANTSYTIADLCQPIHGVFQDSMISFVHAMIQTAQFPTTSKYYQPLLRDCYSYELISMLYRDPVAIYAALLYTFACLIGDDVLMQLASAYLSGKRSRPTLEWEDMYNKYMERYEYDE